MTSVSVSVGTTPRQTGDRWTRLVRETLRHLVLTLEVNEGSDVTFEFGGRRYLLQATRAEEVEEELDHVAVLTTPPATPRDHKGLLSPYTLGSPEGEVHVPFWAITRDYKQCVHGNIEHGWPVHGVSVGPAAIVVLALRDGHDDCAHGWYVRKTNSSRLAEVPRRVRRDIIEWMRSEEELKDSQLLQYNAHAHGDAYGFHERAVERFREYRQRVRAAVRSSKKRKTCDTEADYMAGEPQTCVVCLEDRPTARARCRGGTCTANVCEVCHADSRGLCPICNRTAINAEYPCARCHQRTPLRQYGYECIGCGNHTLCRSCYSNFRECCSCEAC